MVSSSLVNRGERHIWSIRKQDKIDFTSTFQILVQSGIPVIEALVFLENDAAKAKLRNIAKELRRQIVAGSTFADTIAKYPKVFGDKEKNNFINHYTSLV